MARMYPTPMVDTNYSGAERLLYGEFRDKLSDEFTVLHSVGWLSKNPRAHKPQGEADFLIAHPDHGFLVVEVKGGIAITCDPQTQRWESTDRNNQRHLLKQDPFSQASDSAYALLEWLEATGAVNGPSWLIGYAVAFPEVRENSTLPAPPDQPRDIIIDITSLEKLESKVLSILGYWKARYPFKRPPHQHGVRRAVELLSPRREFRAPLSSIFKSEAEEIRHLTDLQFSVLHLLQHHRQAVIVGGAGTGKTVIAIEKARMLLESSFRTLFLCFNRNLQQHVESVIASRTASRNYAVLTYHKLASLLAERAGISTPAGFLDHPAETLQQAATALRSQGRIDDVLFDAVIVDEAQDFEDDWWIPLTDVLRSPQNGILYIFIDDNQSIYTQIRQFPIDSEQEPFVLTENCRNTHRIFDSLRPYSRVATYELRCRGPVGREVEQLPADRAETNLQQKLDDLVNRQELRPSDIIVLTPSTQSKSRWKEGQCLGRFTLTWDLFSQGKDVIRVCTIHAFKGLESDVVILTELDRLPPNKSDQLMYVGLSRARHHAIVMGSMPQPQAF